MDKAVRESKTESGGAGRLSALQEPQVSLRSRIIEALRRAIETGVLAPGARLIERELCEQLKVSRTSLREALGELQAEGILSYSPTRRLSVSVMAQRTATRPGKIIFFTDVSPLNQSFLTFAELLSARNPVTHSED